MLVNLVVKVSFELNHYVLFIRSCHLEPIPGGCNLEFPVEISPFLKITTDSIRDRIEYQHASLSERYQRDCIQAQLMINYDLYIYYLKENDYSEEEYFRAIKIMSEVNSIKQNAIKVTFTKLKKLPLENSYFLKC